MSSFHCIEQIETTIQLMLELPPASAQSQGEVLFLMHEAYRCSVRLMRQTKQERQDLVTNEPSGI